MFLKDIIIFETVHLDDNQYIEAFIRSNLVSQPFPAIAGKEEHLTNAHMPSLEYNHKQYS